MPIINIAKQVIQTEIEGLDFMSNRIDGNFVNAVNKILQTKGRVIICGMGKSGIIGKKIAASFASTGTPSFFMHPGEAFHGDLGMVKSEDIFIAISNSGETDEVLKLLPFLHNNNNFIIALTSNNESTLAVHSQCHLDIQVPKEACNLQLAPTSSTTAALVMGDALTVALMEERKFQPEHFARFHPGGSLGKRLLGKVSDEVITDNLPIVSPQELLTGVINSITSGQLGLSLVMSGDEITSIITDGDLRRAFEQHGKSAFDLIAEDIATVHPLSVSFDSRVHCAYELMEDNNVSSLVVLDKGVFVGLIKK
jgi:arabinose-5-phosphate isomerase